MNKNRLKRSVRVGLSLITSIILGYCLSGKWWYEVVQFKLTIQGQNISVHVHGGLFKTRAQTRLD